MGNFGTALNASSGRPFCPAQLSQAEDTVRVLKDPEASQDLRLCIYDRSAGGNTWQPLSQTSAASISEPLSESSELKLTGLDPTASVILGFGGR